MVRTADEMAAEIREKMRGGAGKVRIKHIFKPGEVKGKVRLIAEITLPAGASIGYHIHENEEEIFYFISGQGEVDDNGGRRQVGPGDAMLTAVQDVAHRADERSERKQRGGDGALAVFLADPALLDDGQDGVVERRFRSGLGGDLGLVLGLVLFVGHGVLPACAVMIHERSSFVQVSPCGVPHVHWGSRVPLDLFGSGWYSSVS